MSQHPPLGPRGKCLIPGCRCLGFFKFIIGEHVLRYIPDTATDHCHAGSCGHGWISHQGTDPIQSESITFDRGGASTETPTPVYCGGYHPGGPIGELWNPSVICICSLPWAEHRLPLSAQSSAPAPAPHFSPTARDSLSSSSAHLHLVPPSSTITGSTHPSVGNPSSSVGHPMTTQPSPLYPPSSWTSVGHSAVTQSSVTSPPITHPQSSATQPHTHTSASSRPVQLWNGPPPPVGGTHNTRRMHAAARHQNPSPAGRLTMSAYNSRQSSQPFHGRVQPPEDSTKKLPVAVIPLVQPYMGFFADVGRQAKEFKFTSDDLTRLIKRLTLLNLTFTVTLPATGPVWRELNDQIGTHITSHGLAYGTDPYQEVASPENTPFRLLSASRRAANNLTIGYSVEKFLVDADFTIQRLLSHAGFKKIPNHLSNSGSAESSMLLVVPRYGNILGPITGFEHSENNQRNSAQHRCFGFKALDINYNNPSLRPVTDTACLDHCLELPTPLGDPFDEDFIPPVVVFSGRTHPDPLLLLAERPVNEPEPVIEANAENQAAILPRPPRRPRASTGSQASQARPLTRRRAIRSPSPIRRTPDLEPSILSRDELETWQIGFAEYVPRNQNQVYFCGEHAQGVSLAYVDVLLWLHDKPDTRKDWANLAVEMRNTYGVTIGPLAPEQREFLAPGQTFLIGAASGNGPHHTVIHLALNTMFSEKYSDFIVRRGDYFIPRFHPTGWPGSQETKWQYLRALGFLCAIHSAILLLGPDPFSPFLYYALLTGGYCADPENWLPHQIDTVLAQTLAPWYTIRTRSPIPRDPRSEVMQLLSIHFDDPNIISDERSVQVHEYWTKEICSATLIRQQELDRRTEFISLVKGFNVHLSEDRNFLERIPQITSFTGSLYARRVKTPMDIIAHIKYYQLEEDGVSRSRLALPSSSLPFETKFHSCLISYLEGAGHPHADVDIVAEIVSASPDLVAVSDDPLLRSHKFLVGMTGIELLPSGDEWSLDIIFKKRRSEHVGSNEDAPIPIHFHACSSYAEVVLDNSMQVYLADVDPGIHPTSCFDCWLHGQLVLGGDINDTWNSEFT